MLPKNSRHVLYAVLLITLSVVCTSAVANTRVFSFIANVASNIESSVASSTTEDEVVVATKNSISNSSKSITRSGTAALPMFMTIIQGADEELVCADDGSTVAKFNLCGDSDDRIISVSGGGSLEWQQVTGGCTPDLNTPCPDASCSYATVGTGSTFTIDASTIPAATGAEFRVRANGSGPWYYFEVAKSTITQTFVKTDFICGVDGRIQITGLSSAYEFSIDSGSGFGPWQGPIFDNLTPGFYNIKARQQGTPGACEYPYAPIEIVQQDIAIDVTFVDAQCSGDTGSVTVNVNNTVPGPYKYTLLDASGVPQEFTAFLPADNYTFSAVGFGTYIVQVETQQCTGDPLNGIDPPRQPLDTSGNPIVIGNGLSALDASTEVNSSFGCSTITSVDITVNTSGGSAPYTFTVNGGASQPSYTGSTTFTVTAPGSYDFLITDSNGCTIPASANVEDLAPPTVNAVGVDGTCSNGGARINFNVVNANGYNLSYRVNAVDPFDTDPSISVPAGTYNDIEVLYQQGGFQCTMALPPITVTSVGAITGSATKIADRTCDGSGGTIGGQIDFGPAGGGTGSGYTFSIDGVNFSATTSFTGLVPGTYTPMIEDGGGCRLTLTSITIDDIDPPADIDFISTNSNCTANTVDLQLVPTSNAAIVNYSIISPAVQNNGGSDTFISLDASQSYIFQITDANNCTYTEGYSPAIISSIRARVRSGGDTQVCSGASDGSGAFLIDGFANTYQYQINAGAPVTGQTAAEVPITGLGAGTYTITITDEDTGCTDTASFTVQEPATPLSLTGTVTPMSCNNGNLGRVVANASGGWGNNRYTLTYPNGVTTVGPKSGPTFGALSAASSPGNPYTLLVEDAEGCTATFTFDLTPIDSPTIALDAASSDLCYVPGTGATLAVTSTAGTAAIGTHQYRINGGALQASATFTNLSPGNYSIEVVDGNNCSDTINMTINPQLRVNTSIETAIPCGGADGRIRVLVTGGYLTNPTPKFFEVSSDNGGTFAAPVAFTANNFPYDTNVPGTYIFRVSDNEGCLAESTPITLDPPVSIAAATVAINPVSCGNTSNGVVTITPDATSGIPPYEISFNGSAFTAQTVYSNLPVGTYPFIVRDSRGCETLPADAIVTLDATPTPDATVSEIPASCNAGNIVAGGIQIDNVTDGTENFSFIIEDSFGNQLVRVDDVARAALPFAINDPSLVPGDYTIITLDANGCRDIDTTTITTADVIITPINFTPAVTCDDTGFTYTVQVTPTIFPTIPTYEIRIQGQPAFYALNNNAGNDTHEFSNATDGIQYGVAYTVEVLAPNGCIYEQEIPPIDGFSDIDITATSGSAFCDDNGNGQTDFTIVDFLGPNLTIEFIDVATNTVIDTDLPTGLTGGLGSSYSGSFTGQPGAYRILVTDSDGCTDAINIDVVLNAPRVDVLSNVPANCNALGQITFIGSGGTPFIAPASPYLYAVVPQGNPVDEDGTATPLDPTDDFTDATTRVLAGSLVGVTYDIWVLDSRGCTFNVSQEVVQLQPDLPTPTFVVDNQCAVASPSFDIVVSVPSTVDTPRFTLGGDEQFGVLNGGGTAYEYTYTVGTPGNYIVDVVDANGCTGQGTAVVYEFLSASGGFSTESTCNNADGEITIIPLGGSGNFDYQLTGTDYLGGGVGPVVQSDDPVFTNVTPGVYQVLVTDRDVTDGIANCTFLVDNISLDAAILPIILPPDVQNITCNGDNDGSIDISLQAGTDVDAPIDYRLVDFVSRALITNNTSGSFPNLAPGSYEVEVMTARNCPALSGRLDITEPAVYTISAAAPDFTCEPGANRFSSTILTATITSPGTAGNYRYSITGFENYQTSPTFEIVDDGSVQNITVYSIDDNGCQATASVTINPPMDVVPSIVQIDPLNCRDPERVRIEVVGTTDFTVSTISAIAVAPVTNTPGNNFVDVFLPASGDYLFEVQDNLPLGCAYPMPIHTVVEPIEPVVVIAEAAPIGCFGASDGELSIDVTNYTGLYSYTVYSGSDPGKTTPLATGNLDTANNPETITGLPGGNFFVEVTSTATPFCSADSNNATIRTPNGVLNVTANEVGNVSCNDNAGIIEAIGAGGWDTSPYEFRLLMDDGSGTYPNEIQAFSVLDRFENLSSGDYRVAIRDVEGCMETFDINLPIVPQIDAGIREPLALQCPNGNNAILEAYDPTTGDAITATAGASGGFPGAGYTYRLLYLNSNDNTDIASTSGLQNTPTFIGASGGFISAGWYAIEVTSSFDCAFVTAPYEVNPPPPIEPRLAQTRVPGCGGNGQIRLFIDNHDPLSNFEYEYRQIPTPNPATDPWIDMGVGVTELFFDVPGSIAGISYQYEVRKKNAANTCLPVNSNGITLTDASGITLLPNDITPISCASEIDGRAESFTFGGVGNNQFYLYQGDPVDAFSPNPAATLIRGPQDFGTFEGLPAGTDYYIAVTSGMNCSDISPPFEIVVPEPIIFVPTATPTSCNGAADGTITLEVTSGGVGLIQFAIAPNFNEFFSEVTTPGMYTFDELAAGDYEVLIQDENGCFERTTVNIPEPEVVSANLIDVTPETCIGFADGTAQISVVGGTPFVDPSTFDTYYETRLVGPNSDGSEVFVRNDNLYFDNLIGGESYIVFIRDANDCPTDIIIPIEIGVDLTATPDVVYGCEGIFPNSTATVTMLDTSLLPDLLFALDPIDPTDAISSDAGTETSWGDLPAGDHIVYIYHQNGCTNSVTFTTEAYEPLTLTAEKTGPNEVTALAEGGYGNYEYFFQGESTGTETVFTTNESGVVNIQVRDEMGCVATIAIPFEFTGMLEIPNFFTPDGDNNNDFWAPNNRDFFPNIEVKIYDRYGRVVAILDQIAKWDGKYEGTELPSGDYWYVVNANDKSKIRYVGHFTLYR
ncbi:MAG: T9SS type B sorting domain-containing protein [Maribacter sp.]|uniref:T9SS type B sorting domain-containing protein n=1 Tax=Maribacter sp. TaxID=1897614 RepID=UPI003298A048